MSIILEIVKWLSQLLIVTSGIAALFSDTTRRDPNTKRRTLTTAGRITVSTIIVGFIAFGVSDIVDYRADVAKDQQNQQEIANLNTLVSQQKDVIANEEQLARTQQAVLGDAERLDLSRSDIEGIRVSWVIDKADGDLLRRLGEQDMPPAITFGKHCFAVPSAGCQCQFAWNGDGVLESSCKYQGAEVAGSPDSDMRTALQIALTAICQNLTVIGAGGNPLFKLIDFKNITVSLSEGDVINFDLHGATVRFDQLYQANIAFKLCQKRSMSLAFRLKSLDSRFLWDQQFLPPHWHDLHQDLEACDPTVSDYTRVNATLK